MMGAVKRIGVLAAVLVLALSACSNGGQDTATLTREPAAPSAAADPESIYLTLLQLGGDAYGSATDEQLISAGWAACAAFDAGSGLDLAPALTVPQLPDDVRIDAHRFVAMTAAVSLCPEHQ